MTLHDREAERRLLGGLLRWNAIIPEAAEVVTADDFADHAHGLIFRALLDLDAAGKPADMVTAADLLAQRGQLDDAGRYAYLFELWECDPTGANALHHAAIVRGLSLRRRLTVVAAEIARDAEDGVAPPDDLVEDAERKVFALATARRGIQAQPLSELLDECHRRLATRRGDETTGIPTGFADLDRLTAGLQDSELVVVGARPGVGKTAIAGSIARHAAVDLGIPVYFASLEMSGVELAERLLCSQGGIDGQRLRRGLLTAHEGEAIHDATERLRSAPLLIDETPAQTATRISGVARRLKAKHDVRLVVVDYLQLVEPEDRRAQRYEQVGAVARRLKNLARELKVPVVALAQVGRDAEDRARPKLRDLRESGDIEANADVVMLLHRAERFPEIDVIEVLVEKQRNGPIGEVTLAYRKRFLRFEDYTPDPFANGEIPD